MNLLKGQRLLLLEDDYLTAMRLKRMVTSLGAEVVGLAGNLGIARPLVEREQIDAAILDVRVDGHTSLDFARELMAAAGVPVILATGYDPAVLPEAFGKARS